MPVPGARPPRFRRARHFGADRNREKVLRAFYNAQSKNCEVNGNTRVAVFAESGDFRPVMKAVALIVAEQAPGGALRGRARVPARPELAPVFSARGRRPDPSGPAGQSVNKSIQ